MDISPMLSTSVALICNFEVDDAEFDWERPVDSIDLVDFRSMAGAFSDWGFIYREAFKCLKPGGWIELVDFYDHKSPKNFYSRFPPESMMHQFLRDLEEAENRAGRRRGVGHMEKDLLIDAGFVDIDVTDYSIPLDPNTSPLGKLWLVACRAGLEASSLRPLTKYMGWSPERVREVCHVIGTQMIQMALRPETSKGFDVKLKVVVARKPAVPGQWTAQSMNEYGEIPEYSTEDDSTIGSGR
jgi:SAM-dependent methyltransferase